MSLKNRNKIITIITNIPTPYRIPLFNEIRRQLESKDLRLKVVFGAANSSRRKWNVDMLECEFDYEILSSRKIPLHDPEKEILAYTRVLNIVKKENPCAIIITGFSFATTKLWLRSLFKNIKYIIWSGAVLNRYYRQDSFLRRLHRRILIKRASGFVAYGTKAKEYLISLGADPEKVSIGINTVDTEFFKNETKKISIVPGNNKKYLLSVGHLMKGKRIDLLFYAIKSLLKKRNDFILKLVGSGPEIENLKVLADKLNIVDYVSFEGFKQKGDIPKYFAEADCFLFPSGYDIWGLVLIEAMAAGLPCVSSIASGVTCDLIEDSMNGFAVDFHDIEKVTEKIDWIFDNPELSKKIGQNAYNFIKENACLEKSAMGFLEAIFRALNNTI